jgi:hypothetical protein
VYEALPPDSRITLADKFAILKNVTSASIYVPGRTSSSESTRPTAKTKEIVAAQEALKKKLVPGRRVRAKWRGSRDFYKGMIHSSTTGADGHPYYHVLFDVKGDDEGGEYDTAVPVSGIKLLEPESAFAVNDSVLALWCGMQSLKADKWYPCKIVQVTRENFPDNAILHNIKYTVCYDEDGVGESQAFIVRISSRPLTQHLLYFPHDIAQWKQCTPITSRPGRRRRSKADEEERRRWQRALCRDGRKVLKFDFVD